MPSKLPSGSTNVGLSRARGGSSDKLRRHSSVTASCRSAAAVQRRRCLLLVRSRQQCRLLGPAKVFGLRGQFSTPRLLFATRTLREVVSEGCLRCLFRERIVRAPVAQLERASAF